MLSVSLAHYLQKHISTTHCNIHEAVSWHTFDLILFHYRLIWDYHFRQYSTVLNNACSGCDKPHGSERLYTKEACDKNATMMSKPYCELTVMSKPPCKLHYTKKVICHLRFHWCILNQGHGCSTESLIPFHAKSAEPHLVSIFPSNMAFHSSHHHGLTIQSSNTQHNIVCAIFRRFIDYTAAP